MLSFNIGYVQLSENKSYIYIRRVSIDVTAYVIRHTESLTTLFYIPARRIFKSLGGSNDDRGRQIKHF